MMQGKGRQILAWVVQKDTVYNSLAVVLPPPHVFSKMIS